MIRTFRTLSATLAAGLLLTTVAALPAAAGTRVTAAPAAGLSMLPQSRFTLTVNPGEKFDPATARSVKLTCEPAGGTHPNAAKACKQLAEVDGMFNKLDVDPGPCPFIWAPVHVTAKGNWRLRSVSYEETFPNQCVLNRATGAVFAF